MLVGFVEKYKFLNFFQQKMYIYYLAGYPVQPYMLYNL